MDIDLELFRIFDTVATVRSFSSAAEELKISQPAVSQALRQLEDVTALDGGDEIGGNVRADLVVDQVAAMLDFVGFLQEWLQVLGALEGVDGLDKNADFLERHIKLLLECVDQPRD